MGQVGRARHAPPAPTSPYSLEPVKKYAIKEVFGTLQGEGAQAGSPSVFLRFAGCNLWSGREEDRAAATCWFCDTNFVGTDGENGGKFAGSAQLAAEIEAIWEHGAARPGGKRYVSASGTPALATAGSGDLLAGIAGTLLTQGMEPAVAGACAAWVHGQAAESTTQLRVRGISLDDIADGLTRAWPVPAGPSRYPVLAELPPAEPS